MNGNRHWSGWIAVGLSGLALLVALFGRGFGPQLASAGAGGFHAPPYAQQGNPQQSGRRQRGPGMQQGNTQQAGPGAPEANAQPSNTPRGAGPQGNAQQAGPG